MVLGKSTGQWTQDICVCSSPLHIEIFQITMSTVAKEAVAELMTVPLVSLHEVSPYQWNQCPPRHADTLVQLGAPTLSHTRPSSLSFCVVSSVCHLPSCCRLPD